MNVLFSPLRVGEFELVNRIVVAPMCQYSAATVRLARCAGCCASGDADSLAPSRMEAVLAAEVSARPTRAQNRFGPAAARGRRFASTCRV